MPQRQTEFGAGRNFQRNFAPGLIYCTDISSVAVIQAQDRFSDIPYGKSTQAAKSLPIININIMSLRPGDLLGPGLAFALSHINTMAIKAWIQMLPMLRSYGW
eukprot:g67672.t1